jgi:hypothetical protein
MGPLWAWVVVGCVPFLAGLRPQAPDGGPLISLPNGTQCGSSQNGSLHVSSQQDKASPGKAHLDLTHHSHRRHTILLGWKQMTTPIHVHGKFREGGPVSTAFCV